MLGHYPPELRLCRTVKRFLSYTWFGSKASPLSVLPPLVGVNYYYTGQELQSGFTPLQLELRSTSFAKAVALIQIGADPKLPWLRRNEKRNSFDELAIVPYFFTLSPTAAMYMLQEGLADPLTCGESGRPLFAEALMLIYTTTKGICEWLIRNHWERARQAGHSVDNLLRNKERVTSLQHLLTVAPNRFQNAMILLKQYLRPEDLRAAVNLKSPFGTSTLSYAKRDEDKKLLMECGAE